MVFAPVDDSFAKQPQFRGIGLELELRLARLTEERVEYGRFEIDGDIDLERHWRHGDPTLPRDGDGDLLARCFRKRSLPRRGVVGGGVVVVPSCWQFDDNFTMHKLINILTWFKFFFTL